MYYLYFNRTVIVQLQELTLGRAASAASGDAARAATLPNYF
jgi:hypothetical protein